MRFLKALFWLIAGMLIALLAYANLDEIVSIELWDNIIVDIKLPLLLLITFLIGFLPAFLILRARIWQLKRRLNEQATMHVANTPAGGIRRAPSEPPAEAERVATDFEGLADRMTSPVYVALDMTDLDRARALAARIKTHVGGLKLGLEFFAANGPDGVRDMAALGLPIFLDLKLHDIPNTVAKAVHALGALEPAILTVHAAGGRAMLEDAKAAAPSGTKVVAVTMLTSLDDADLAATGVGGNAHEQVVRLTKLAREAGLDGIVCSGAEVAAAKVAWPDGFFVVPGVRPANGETGDQKRVVTPREALDAGASILVVGRPITQADDPDQAARAIAATL